MKFFRHGPVGAERPGLIDGSGRRRDLGAHLTELAGPALDPAALARLAKIDPDSLPEISPEARLGPPVTGVGKFICISLNYFDHAAEVKQEPPREPVVLLKATSSICGPNDTVYIPRGSSKLDWEVELAVIIGRPGKYIPRQQALAHVAGYTIVNDVSARDFQLERGGTWDKGKSCDTFGPVGPWLVTPDEIPDVQALRLWLEVDGHRYQEGNTASMIFPVEEIIAYVSGFMSLQAGDIITTSTPPGNGLAQNPPVFLRPGNVMRLGIDGLGEQCQRVAAD